MASLTPFESAVARTLGIEGGYSNNPNDRGGATCWGVTEAVARADGYAGAMAALTKARALDIYRRLYWDRVGLDWVAAADPTIAAECFDTGVNMGVTVAVTFLQRVLNALNRQAQDYADLRLDGVAGPATTAALRGLLTRRGIAGRQAVLVYLNALQGARYIELAETRPANESFVFGWAVRVALGAEKAP